MRCPSCDARNTDDASWCGQCFATLAPEADAPAAPVPAATSTGGAGPARPDGPRLVDRDDVRATAEGVEWACGVCREWNSMARSTCRVCGADLSLEPAPKLDAPQVRPDTLVAASVLAPGAGHVLLGRTGEGVARLLLAGTWSLGGLTLLRGALGSGRPVLPAVPLLLGWALLVVGCTNDALVHGGGAGRELLHPRALLWLTVAVIGLTAAGAVLGVLMVTGG